MVSRHKLKGYLVLLLVFVLGAAAGGAASFALVQRRHAAMFREGDWIEKRRVHALTRRLDLDADQEQRVAAILARSHDETRALSRDMIDHCGQPLRDHKAKVEGEIRAVLRPDQQQRFDRLVEERREHLWLGPPPGGPPGLAPR